MEDPCNKCLVAPCCDKFCPEKINYNILVENAFSMHNAYIKNNGYQARLTPSFKRHLKKVNIRACKNINSNGLIRKRKRNM